MNFRSHINLSLMLSESLDIPKAAFLFGSVEPDIFFPTYFRNSSNGRFHGHDYANMRIRVVHTVQKLEKMEGHGLLYGYRLGKLMHYISDSFTLAHNEMFHGSIREHRAYESQLEAALDGAVGFRDRLVMPGDGVVDFLQALHDEYMQEAGLPETDASFIMAAVSAAAFVLAGKGISCRAVPLVDTP